MQRFVSFFFQLFIFLLIAQYAYATYCEGSANGSSSYPGTCYYSNGSSPPNYTTNKNNACGNPFGWFCPDFNCSDTSDPVDINSNIGSYCGNLAGARVRCCGQNPTPTPTFGIVQIYPPPYYPDPYPGAAAAQAYCANDFTGTCPNCYSNFCAGKHASSVAALSGYCPFSAPAGYTGWSCESTGDNCITAGGHCLASCGAGWQDLGTSDCPVGGNYQCCKILPTPTPACVIGACGSSCGGTNERYVSSGWTGSCGNWYGGPACYQFANCPCTAGPVCGPTCNINPPANQCGSMAGSWQCTNTTSNTGSTYCTQNQYTTGCTGNYNTCTPNYSCPGSGNCVTSITATVTNNFDPNGSFGSNSNPTTPHQGASVTLSGSASQQGTTDGTGKYVFSGLTTGNYSVTLAGIAGYAILSTNPANVGLTNNYGAAKVDFQITPLYQIKGTLFYDHNDNQKDDGGVENFSNFNGGANSITVKDVNGNTMSTLTPGPDGSFDTGQILKAGQYTVTYTIPNSLSTNNYSVKTPSSFTVIVGKNNGGGGITCSIGASLNASCLNNGNTGLTGSIQGVDFGLNNATTGGQIICADIRYDTSFVDKLPAPGTTCGTVNYSDLIISDGTCDANHPGILFLGNGATADLGLGKVSVSGETGNAETFATVSNKLHRPSYDYVYSSILASQSNANPFISLTSVCPDLTDCTLPADLANGLYKSTDGAAVTLNGYAFPNNKQFIMMIPGDLYINGNILVPSTSSVFFFVKGNIYVNANVGQDLDNITSRDANIEGVFNTDNSFTLLSNSATTGTICQPTDRGNGLNNLDKRINITGVITLNNGGTGGTFVNQRDLCTGDLTCPVWTVGSGNGDLSGSNMGTNGSNTIVAGNGLNYLLNAPAVIKHLNIVWQEVTP